MENPPENSKSLVLITRVGSTPTTGIKRKLPQTSWWSFLFYLRRVRREQHCTLSQKKRPDFVGTFLFICGTSCVHRQFCSALFRPCRECFWPPVFIAAVLPGISGNDRLFCRKVVLYREKSIKTLLRPFIPPFLTDFTMFFMKKALQMNFKNILYNYKLSFFMQTFSYRFVWGRQACAFRTASALR